MAIAAFKSPCHHVCLKLRRGGLTVPRKPLHGGSNEVKFLGERSKLPNPAVNAARHEVNMGNVQQRGGNPIGETVKVNYY